MEVIKISPRGYCYGVVDALKVADKAAKDSTLPRPIHIIGQIIHNRHAIEDLSSKGVITIDGPDRLSILEQVKEGTVIFTAHGVSPAVKQRAQERGLYCIDATCPDVTVTHDLVKDLVAKGYYVIYIGKKGHPEPEGVIGEVPGHISLVEVEADVDVLQLTEEQQQKLAVSTQTTLSLWDTHRVIKHIKEKYPQTEVYVDICRATQTRQEAVAEQARGADLTVVVGDPRSNNTNRLVQVSQEKAGVPAVRIEDLSQLDTNLLRGKKKIAVTAGASTPSQITRAVIRFLEEYQPEEAEQTSNI
ncbi:4-hydroxy-3-methylbut-2-enyl diphosphate reductase [Ktedonospora formicarum]|uniref:4-hydroxy-3-methylbut-2-enyl diphosphate reductase n=1 Tax=Ktedonospora formicarum TaxID=2778364 RepID=A0A8J3HUE7_9CHLR|nr:4-hydroxy-3-methylbut-2-enyl diphosphate reductase [Ktedonospora formicarum]GHO43949.1 4-hydroxy-3-methylbut-2-enyl diphosphate reductase [Ktedonospora formicarum]